MTYFTPFDLRRRAVGCTVLHMTFTTYLSSVQRAHMRIFGQPIELDDYDLTDRFRKAWADGLSASSAVVLLCEGPAETDESALFALYES